MLTMAQFLALIDQYKAAANIDSDGALSARIFDDGKKIAAMRGGRDITLSRLLKGMGYLAENWPSDHELPDELRDLPSDTEAAA